MNTVYSKYGHRLLLFITTLLSTLHLSFSSDTINSTQIFRDDGSTTLVSSSGHYELGFFSPDNSDNRYLAIWYKRVSPRTVVWVANRDNPLRGIPTGALRVVQPGILALQNRTGGIAWSTNTSRAVQNPVAKLLDSGNLVVKDASDDDNPDNFLWQSFDYPTDTTLPGMKLGVNFQTGREVHITASKSNGNPASGDYTFHCDPTGYPQLVTRKGDVLQYSSGPWNGLTFSGSVNLRRNPIFTFGVVINKDEVYYHYDLLNESIYTRYTLSDAGVRQRLIWDYKKQSWTLYYAAPTDGCDIFNRCGPYGRCSTENTQKICGCLEKFKPIDPQGWDNGDWSKGCNRSTPLNCEKGDGFLKYSGVKLPNTRHSWYNTTMTLAECEVECSNNCSCTAYASLDISKGENGCLIWFDELIDIREMSPGQDIYIRLSSSEIDSERKRKILIITLCVVFGILIILSLSILLYLYLKRKKKLNLQLEKTGKPKLTSNANHLRVSHNEEFELPQFSLSTIKEATDNFSINNELGKGGFGPVYKGTLEDGKEIAVKRLSGTSRQGVDQFKNEVLCIAKLQHRNLVKLLGWCSEGDEMMLVYEYLTNKSLDKILFDPTRSTLLDWPRRLNIINGIARGLLYLHQDSCLRVIHRDLKASNILLDSDMNAKISDFGFARTFGGNETEANTSLVVGTYGYMSPEYAMEGNFSFKSDVYSFGVLVLEVVSGKRNRGFTHMDQRLNLLGHAWTLYKEDKSVEVVDSCVRNSLHLTEIMRTIHIGLLCVQEQPDDRPTMSSVVFMLSNDVVLAEAKCPGFFTAREVPRTATSGSSRPRSSINTMTITQLEPR